MRKFAFVVFDIDNSIKDRFAVRLVTSPTGLGFKLKLSTIDGDIESVLTKVVQEKQEVKFAVNQVHFGYDKANLLTQWLEKYSGVNQRMAIEYDDGTRKRYCEGRVTSLDKTEKDEYDNLVQQLTFRPLTPFFSNIENTIRIQTSATGKSYPFRYPYSYGRSVMENNEINNPYLLEVPVTVKITGSIFEPTVRLIDESGTTYNRVQFTGVTLLEGQYLIINSAERKIYYYNGSDLMDYTAETDPSYDTFLRAKNGISRLSINLEGSDTGELTGSWRQYGL
jgi:hypothetical protein